MKLIKTLIQVCCFALVLIMPSLIFSISSLRQTPKLSVYKGELKFDGDGAYTNLKNFLDECPQRYAGTPRGIKSADYIASEFEKLGLKTTRQEFNCIGSQHLRALASLQEAESNRNGMNSLSDSFCL